MSAARPIFQGATLLALATVPSIAAEIEGPPKASLEATIFRGAIVFEKYCQLCHGMTAEGNGRAAKIYDPKPANLVKSDKNDQYNELIIRGGGERVGRSKFMPPWGNELTDEQIADVIAFVRSIKR